VGSIVQRLHAFLGRLYDVDSSDDINEFLVTDRIELSGIQSHDDARSYEEALLMAPADDGARLSLFIDAAVLHRLERHDPMDALSERNLPDYCTALEGVSHFAYAAWRLRQDSPVSLLELETQAEVDKFAATIFLLAYQRGGAYPSYVFARLFDAASFDAQLAPDQLDRYLTAHRCAARYCSFLERRFVRRGVAQVEAMLRELRKFYRLGCTAKLDYALAAG
jgi:hypothetical protein